MGKDHLRATKRLIGQVIDDRVQGSLRFQTLSNTDLYQKVCKWMMAPKRKVDFTNNLELREGESIGSDSISDDGVSSEDEDTEKLKANSDNGKDEYF
ncbi:hypothetical protein ACFX1W_030513 [Malus domestica]